MGWLICSASPCSILRTVRDRTVAAAIHTAYSLCSRELHSFIHSFFHLFIHIVVKGVVLGVRLPGFESQLHLILAEYFGKSFNICVFHYKMVMIMVPSSYGSYEGCLPHGKCCIMENTQWNLPCVSSVLNTGNTVGNHTDLSSIFMNHLV